MRALIIILVLILVVPGFSYGAPEGGKGASDQAIFNRVGDWFAAVGKSEEERAAIKAERKAKREAKRLEKEARKNKEKIEEKIRARKKKADKKMQGSINRMQEAKGKGTKRSRGRQK